MDLRHFLLFCWRLDDQIFFSCLIFSLQYPNNARCENVINNNAFAQGKAIKLTVLQLRTEAYADILNITDAEGNSILMDGSWSPGTVRTFYSRQITAVFKSNAFTNYVGYQLQATLIDNPFKCPLGQYRCKTGNQCIPETQRCDGTSNCNDGSDEKGSFCPGKIQNF